MATTRVHTTNPTGIKHLPASVITVQVTGEAGNELFDAKLHGLEEYVSDPKLRITLSVGAGNTVKSFDFGTVGSPGLPEDVSASGLDQERPRSFRLIVWDPDTKKVVASNERLPL